MLLNELFKTAPTYTVDKEFADIFLAKSTIGQRDICFKAIRLIDTSESHDAWELLFYEQTEHGRHTFKATGSGQAFEVGAFVVAVLKEFVQRYHPNELLFSASGGTRSSIYRKAIVKALPKYKEVSSSEDDNRDEPGADRWFTFRAITPA